MALLTLLATGVLFALHFTSDRPNQKQNGFTRNLNGFTIEKIVSRKLNFKPKDICGFSGDSVFIADKQPGIIHLFNAQTKTEYTFDLHLLPIPQLAPVFYTWVDFPNIYILGGIARCAIKGDLIAKTCEKASVETGGFGNGIILNDESFIVRTVDTPGMNSLFKKGFFSSHTIINENEISPKLSDAGFSYDGHLSYDRKSNKLFFVCYYNNKITCFDTSLNLIYTANTIDTISSPNIEIRRTKTSITLSKPPITINPKSVVREGILYVISKLRADNEHKDISDNVVVDMYNSADGNYNGSFYLPIDSHSIEVFEVLDDKRALIVKDQELTIYKITQIKS
jgi:hypothetical protein